MLETIDQYNQMNIRIFSTYKKDISLSAMTSALTPKHRDTHGCVVSTVTTDAKAPSHQHS